MDGNRDGIDQDCDGDIDEDFEAGIVMWCRACGREACDLLLVDCLTVAAGWSCGR